MLEVRVKPKRKTACVPLDQLRNSLINYSIYLSRDLQIGACNFSSRFRIIHLQIPATLFKTFFIPLWYTLCYLVLLGFMLFVILIYSLTPDFLNWIRPLNKSRVHIIICLKEYNMKEELQYHLFYAYAMISVLFGTMSILSVGAILVVFILHTCATFKICSYRIQHSIDDKVLARPDVKNVIIGRIISMIKMHYCALKLFQFILTSFTVEFLLMLGIGLLSFVSTMYRFLIGATSDDDLIDIICAAFYLFGHAFYLFGTTYVSQLFINHADELFYAVNTSLWYKAPVTVQKYYLFLMQVTSKSVVPNLGGIYISKMESFTAVVSTAISYMMVFYSLQQ